MNGKLILIAMYLILASYGIADVTAETYDGMRIMGDEVLCGGQN